MNELVPMDRCITVMPGHEGSVNVARFTADGTYCLTGGDDRTIKLWNPHKADPSAARYLAYGSDDVALMVKSYEGVHGYAVLSLCIASDKSKFASAGREKNAFLWDVATGRTVRRIQAHAHSINAVDFNEDATVLLAASYDQTLSCWDLRSQSREPVQRMTDFKDSVSCLARTPGDGAVLAGSVDGCVRTYDLRRGALHTDNLGLPVTSLAVSGDGHTCLSCCLGGPVVLLDLASGRRLREFSGHTHSAFKLEAGFQSDERQVLCGSEDGAVLHWDLLTAQQTQCNAKAHEAGRPICSVHCHPQKPIFLTASHDGSAKCWAAASHSTSGPPPAARSAPVGTEASIVEADDMGAADWSTNSSTSSRNCGSGSRSQGGNKRKGRES